MNACLLDPTWQLYENSNLATVYKMKWLYDHHFSDSYNSVFLEAVLTAH